MSIIVENASKRFGDFQAVDDVSLTVPDGSLTALLGPSGSGKSTLLRIIAGLESPDSGRIMIQGNDTTNVPAQKRNVGFVFQHYAAFKHMTVHNNVAFGLKIRKRDKAEIDRRVNELLALVHLDGLAQRYPSQLSGGQRQRMALARALGEFGAVAVISGRISGQTQTATIWIQQAFQNFDQSGAYLGAVVLALLAVSILVAMNVFKRKEAT